KFGLLAFLACVIAGCQRGSPPQPGVVVALDAEPQSLDPRFGTDVPSSRAADLLHTGLTRGGPGSTRVPALASAWRAPDPRTLVFQLRRDFRFASRERAPCRGREGAVRGGPRSRRRLAEARRPGRARRRRGARLRHGGDAPARAVSAAARRHRARHPARRAGTRPRRRVRRGWTVPAR